MYQDLINQNQIVVPESTEEEPLPDDTFSWSDTSSGGLKYEAATQFCDVE